MASMMGLSRDWSLVSTAPVGLALEASKLRWGKQEETSKSAMVKGMGFQSMPALESSGGRQANTGFRVS